MKKFIDVDLSYTHNGSLENGVVFYENNELVKLEEGAVNTYPYAEQFDRRSVILFIFAEVEKENFIVYNLKRNLEMKDDKFVATNISGLLLIPENLKEKTNSIIELFCENITDRNIEVIYFNPAEKFLKEDDVKQKIEHFFDETVSLEQLKSS